MMSYIALIHKEDTSDFGVSFPDFPGCVTAGSTLDEAREMAQEALALHIEGMIEDGETIPEPSTMDVIANLPESAKAVFALIPAPPARSASVRVNVTLPESVLKDIDRYAREHGFSRSGFLVHASRLAMRNGRAA